MILNKLTSGKFAAKASSRLPPSIVLLGAAVVFRLAGLVGFTKYLRDRRSYRALEDAGPILWRNDYPQVHDRTEKSPFDRHYFYQDVWAAHRISEADSSSHVDIGSRVDLVGFLSAIKKVKFVDIRPLEVELDNFESVEGSILELPFGDRSLESLSCLHVAEHIGLGRYGDPLNPNGTKMAAAELQRVLGLGGQLLFSLPIGRPRTCFNAHRVHSSSDVLDMFPELELVEFSGVDDDGNFKRFRSLSDLDLCSYGCGMFRFVRGTG